MNRGQDSSTISLARTGGRGPDKVKLWSNVQGAAKDLSAKALSVNGVYGNVGTPLPGGPIDLGGFSVF